MRKSLLLLVPVLALGACTWGIQPDLASRNVHTAWNTSVAQCHQLGKITVSVADHIGPVDRNDIKVRDELEVMARNEAASMGADTVKPLGHPVDGSQAWGAYQCGASGTGAAPAGAPTAPAVDQGTLQTFPVKSGG